MDQEEIVKMSQDDRKSAPAVQLNGKGQLNSGIVVFSSMRKALYVNEVARRVLIQLNQQDEEQSTNSALPRSVNALLDEMLPLLATADLDRGWKQLEVRRLMAVQGQPVWVKTFGIPDRSDIRRALIVLTIQEAA